MENAHQTVTVTKILSVRCANIDALGENCPNPALAGNMYCCQHLGMEGFTTQARHEPTIWVEIGPGVFRRRKLYPGE